MIKNSKRIISILMILIMITLLGSGFFEVNVKASNGTVKWFIGDSNTPRHHKAIPMGDSTEELSFSIKDETVKSYKYVSDNTSSFKIKNTSNGRCIVETISEGTGYVILTVNTKEGNTYVEKLFISVFSRMKRCTGISNISSEVYRGASENAKVENEDIKGKIEKGKKYYIIAMCNEFYLLQTTNGETYADGYDTGFVKKEDINIIADSINIEESEISLGINEEKKLTAKITPDMVTNKSVIWESSDTEIATVSDSGEVVGKKEGTVCIRATKEDEKKLVEKEEEAEV